MKSLFKTIIFLQVLLLEKSNKRDLNLTVKMAPSSVVENRVHLHDNARDYDEITGFTLTQFLVNIFYIVTITLLLFFIINITDCIGKIFFTLVKNIYNLCISIFLFLHYNQFLLIVSLKSSMDVQSSHGRALLLLPVTNTLTVT